MVLNAFRFSLQFLKVHRLSLLLFLYGGLIFGSLLPSAAPSAKYGFDIGVHTFVYAALTFVTIYLLGNPIRTAICIFALSSAIELLQEFVPGRSGTIEDVAANGIGIGIVAIIACLIDSVSKEKFKGPQ